MMTLIYITKINHIFSLNCKYSCLSIVYFIRGDMALIVNQNKKVHNTTRLSDQEVPSDFEKTFEFALKLYP